MTHAIVSESSSTVLAGFSKPGRFMNRCLMLAQKTAGWVLMAAILVWMGSTDASQAQSKRWYPHPVWGADDQAGASNWMTPDVALRAVNLVRTGEVVELGHVNQEGIPTYGNRPYQMIMPQKGAPVGANAVVANEEYILAPIGHVGTQLDGLGHIGIGASGDGDHGETDAHGGHGTDDDGNGNGIRYYNGVPASEADHRNGLLRLGIEHAKPFITRGILLDIAAVKGIDPLPEAYEVTMADVRAALGAAGIAEQDLLPGDALLFRYGWEAYWEQPERYNTRPPGIGMEVARWLAERRIALTGSDTWCLEVVPNPDPALRFPVHQELLTRNGIYIMENLALDEVAARWRTGAEPGTSDVRALDGRTPFRHEFLLIALPIRSKGAAGSPLRPVAVF
jgi:kynurenine formamidase